MPRVSFKCLISVINFTTWIPSAGGWREVRLQVCVQPRRAFLHGFSRQPEAEFEAWPGCYPTSERGGWRPPPQLWRWGSLSGRRSGTKHHRTGFPWWLPVLDPTAWQLKFLFFVFFVVFLFFVFKGVTYNNWAVFENVSMIPPSSVTQTWELSVSFPLFICL